MNYAAPDIIQIVNPIGLDAVIQSMQNDLYLGLPWLQKSFGRAREMRDDVGGKAPKAYMGLGEYHSVLPNDMLKSQSFIMARESESRPNWPDTGLERTISIVFWMDLKQINANKDYIHSEELKVHVDKVINTNPYTDHITNFWDDRIEDVFMGYVDNYGEDIHEYLKYPYGGFRFDVVMVYPQYDDCVEWSSGGFSQGAENAQPDIEFIVTLAMNGTTTYQNDLLKGKKIRLIREGLFQHKLVEEDLPFWSFDSAGGLVTVSPPWIEKERIAIQIINTSTIIAPMGVGYWKIR
jgi:hypothetical protein